MIFLLKTNFRDKIFRDSQVFQEVPKNFKGKIFEVRQKSLTLENFRLYGN